MPKRTYPMLIPCFVEAFWLDDFETYKVQTMNFPIGSRTMRYDAAQVNVKAPK